MFLYLRFGKLKGLGEFMRTLNASEGEALLDTKCLGSARFLTFMRRMLLRRHLMRPSTLCPYVYGLGSECCFFYYFIKLFVYCNFLSPMLLQTFLSKESSKIP